MCVQVCSIREDVPRVKTVTFSTSSAILEAPSRVLTEISHLLLLPQIPYVGESLTLIIVVVMTRGTDQGAEREEGGIVRDPEVEVGLRDSADRNEEALDITRDQGVDPNLHQRVDDRAQECQEESMKGGGII